MRTGRVIGEKVARDWGNSRRGESSTCEDFLEDFFLGGGHSAGLGGRGVVVAGEVEEAVDDVEGEFAGGVVAEFPGAAGSDGGTDEDFAVGKCDDIGGSGDAEKVAVGLGHGARAEDCDFNGGQGCEPGVVFFREGKAAGKRGAGEGFEADRIVGGVAGTMVK